MYYDLTVPRFASEPLSLSGAIVSAEPAIAAAPREALKAVVTPPPTTRREFQKTDRVAVLVRIYERSKTLFPVSVAIRIVDDRGTEVSSSSDAVGVDRLDGERSADCRFTLPLEKLTRGAYLLEFEATADQHSSRRDVRFVVR